MPPIGPYSEITANDPSTPTIEELAIGSTLDPNMEISEIPRRLPAPKVMHRLNRVGITAPFGI